MPQTLPPPKFKLLTLETATGGKLDWLRKLGDVWAELLSDPKGVVLQDHGEDREPLDGGCRLAEAVAVELSGNRFWQRLSPLLDQRYQRVVVDCQPHPIEKALHFCAPDIYVFKSDVPTELFPHVLRGVCAGCFELLDEGQQTAYRENCAAPLLAREQFGCELARYVRGSFGALADFGDTPEGRARIEVLVEFVLAYLR